MTWWGRSLLVAGLFAGSVNAQLRTWTDAAGRSMEASLVSVSAENVVLRDAGGVERTVPLANLSAADRSWVVANDPNASDDDATLTPDGRKYTGPPAEADWPRSVGLKDSPEVTVIKEADDTREFIYETPHYEFVSDSRLGASAVREFARVFEATWQVNCLLPLDLRPMPEGERAKFKARIFTDPADYLVAGGIPGSAGVYSRRFNALMLPLDSLGVRMAGTRVIVDYVAEDYGTLIHEITHQMMNHWLDRLPLWYVEGSAEYVELAEYDNGRFSFIRLPARLKEHLALRSEGGKFRMLPLEGLMTMESGEWSAGLLSPMDGMRNYASALALTYYFYHLDDDGTHFKEFLKAAAKLPPGGDPAPLVKDHLLRDRDYAELESDVARAFRRIGVTVEF